MSVCPGAVKTWMYCWPEMLRFAARCTLHYVEKKKAISNGITALWWDLLINPVHRTHPNHQTAQTKIKNHNTLEFLLTLCRTAPVFAGSAAFGNWICACAYVCAVWKCIATLHWILFNLVRSLNCTRGLQLMWTLFAVYAHMLETLCEQLKAWVCFLNVFSEGLFGSWRTCRPRPVLFSPFPSGRRLHLTADSNLSVPLNKRLWTNQNSQIL